MTDSKTKPSTQVRVQGKLTGQIDRDGAEHQVYRYHVNILKPDKSRPQEYDREIHLFRSTADTAASNEPANTSASTVKQVGSMVHIKRLAQLFHLLSRPGHDFKRSIQNRYDALASYFGKLHIPAWPRPGFSINRLQLPNIRLVSATHTLGIIKNTFTKRLPKQRNKPPATGKADKPASTPRNITNFRRLISGWPGRKKLLRLCLPCLLLTVAAIIIYYLPGSNAPREKIIYPMAQTDRHQLPADNDYRAVIEKSGRGVVITLQGPDHEEVLTKLPPGYEPVVEGNKIVHVVTPGNTLWFIAMRYIKDPYRYPELARLNHIKNPDLIFPGDKVIIQYIRKP